MLLVVLLPSVAWVADGGPGRRPDGLVDLDRIPPSVSERPAAVVLQVDPVSFAEILADPYERGRHWERVGVVAFLANGDLRFESRVGVRVHGGGSRGRSPKSLRLYFRPSLEAEPVPGEILGFPPDVGYGKLVLHNDSRLDDYDGLSYHYLNPLAYEIAERLGVPVARTAPITIVVNDDEPAPYVVTESLDLDWFEARHGHRDFLVLETKDRAFQEQIRNEGAVAMLRARFGEPSDWSLEEVGQLVDLDNLSRWFMAVLFCGTRDALQGKMVLDRSRPDARWFWVAWDMDLSFSREADNDPPWELDILGSFVARDLSDPDTDARVVILKQLFTASEEFRARFARLYAEARDSLLTPAFVEEALSRYERYAALHGVEDTRYQVEVRDFLTHRPAALDRILERHGLATSPDQRSGTWTR